MGSSTAKQGGKLISFSRPTALAFYCVKFNKDITLRGYFSLFSRSLVLLVLRTKHTSPEVYQPLVKKQLQHSCSFSGTALKGEHHGRY